MQETADVGTMAFLLKFAVAVAPVLVFLAVLILLDSYKLVRFKLVLSMLAVGASCALAAYLINSAGFRAFASSPELYPRFLAPVVEEILKASLLVYLLRSGRVGFAIDAAILGFAIGAGFAVVENLVYLQSIPDTNPFTWLIRGVGTAVMHGGATALFGVFARSLGARTDRPAAWVFLPGLLLACLLHSLYNQAIVSPVATAAAVSGGVPVLMIGIFAWSEKGLRNWLGEGFDRDVELLRMLTTGRFLETRAGQYLVSLTRAFPPATVADMLCALRIRVELALRVKGDLLKREAGFEVVPDPGTLARLEELRFLEKAIGRTGRLAMSPLLPKNARDRWQLESLGYK